MMKFLLSEQRLTLAEMHARRGYLKLKVRLNLKERLHQRKSLVMHQQRKNFKKTADFIESIF